MSSRRIGFVDYRLDNFHAEVYRKALRDPLALRGYRLAGATALLADASRDWCAERDVTYYPTVAELAPHVDCFMVLAPSNPEVHLELCRQTFPFGKPTFVDKTFAPDAATAAEIFDLADAFGTPVQSTSALRSTPIQQTLAELPGPLQHLVVFSSGTSFAEYGIHPIELAVSCLGPEVQEMMRLGSADHPLFVLKFSGERTALIDFNLQAEVPFSAILSSASGSERIAVDGARLFIDAAASILDFFDARRPLVDRRETLAVRRILDMALDEAAWERFAPLDDRPALITVKPSAVPGDF
ncbi:MAG: hypothetical protein KF847_10470 [Pirellulales bacterium]|nr:hypothetical protein [Pirellulales bacterium]